MYKIKYHIEQTIIADYMSVENIVYYMGVLSEAMMHE